jgi:hypothetical protein
MSLFQNYLGPNNVTNMAKAADALVDAVTCTTETIKCEFEKFVMVHTKQHSVLAGLVEFGHAGIDMASKVRRFHKGVQNPSLDFINTQIMASPALSSNFAGVVNLNTNFINSTKAANPDFNVYEVQVTEMYGGQKRSAERLAKNEPESDVEEGFMTGLDTMPCLMVKRIPFDSIMLRGSTLYMVVVMTVIMVVTPKIPREP